jgi:hypothetical protein
MLCADRLPEYTFRPSLRRNLFEKPSRCRKGCSSTLERPPPIEDETAIEASFPVIAEGANSSSKGIPRASKKNAICLTVNAVLIEE